MMRIYITGSNGFLAQKFCERILHRAPPNVLLGVSKSENRNIFLNEQQFEQIDITDFECLTQSLSDFQPTHILHTAAMTTVEGCEENKENAFKINVEVSAFLASYCAQQNIHLTFISTDFVFDGASDGYYAEQDPTNPVNYYGETKVLAEQAIQATNVNAAILRTILVYGAIPDRSRSNLVLWAKSQLEEKKIISVVSDQWRMPTWVDDLADACIAVMQDKIGGLFHISGEEMMTIEEAVVALANTYGFDTKLISPISAKSLHQDKNRPRKTGFNVSKAKKEFDFQPTSYVESLTYICEQLKKYGR